MEYYVMTLFPEMIENCLSESVIGRAAKNGIISIKAVNIRDYSRDKHLHVDDYPYGGGAGMVMQPDPIFDCYSDIVAKAGKTPRVIYLTPQGRKFTQAEAESFSHEEALIFLCGHYEGVDERVLEEIVTDNISIGDYVLTGGELPVMVMIDAISRLIPGVLGKQESAEYDSFQDGLLEYPQYTRPEEFHGKRVPEVLLSGHHGNIARWRRMESIKRTFERRPDLLSDPELLASFSREERDYLQSLINKNV